MKIQEYKYKAKRFIEVTAGLTGMFALIAVLAPFAFIAYMTGHNPNNEKENYYGPFR